MELTQILQLLVDAPTTLIVLYLLVKEQGAHAETRRMWDEDNRQWAKDLVDMAKGQRGDDIRAADQRVLTRLEEL